MCIIIYSPDGIIPKKHLHNSLDANPDGWGIMWPENGKLVILNGMKKNEFFHNWRWLRSVRAPKIFHARIGTHGDKGPDNCHPFVIPGHGELAVAHNGILSQFAYTNEAKSDTKLFVEGVLAKMPAEFYLNTSIQILLKDYIGHSKLAFMDGDGRVVIINSNNGHWVDKMWYSNQSYKSWNRTPAYGGQMGFVPVKPYTPSQSYYSLLPDSLKTCVPCGAPDSKLPEHYKNIGASKGLVCNQ